MILILRLFIELSWCFNLSYAYISFTFEDDDRLHYVDIFGILRFGKTSDFIVFYEKSLWSLNKYDSYDVKTVRLSNLLKLCGEYVLVEKPKPMKNATVVTRKSDGEDFIVLKRLNHPQNGIYYWLRKKNRTALEKIADMTFYQKTSEFENVRDEEVEEELLDARIEWECLWDS